MTAMPSEQSPFFTSLRRLPVEEQDAYMAGQLAALALARDKGLEYASKIIGLSQTGILREREGNS